MMEDMEHQMNLENACFFLLETGQIKTDQFIAIQQCELDEQKAELLKEYLGHGE